MITVSANGRVFLALPGKDYKPRREIGFLSKDGQTFHCERNPERHLFRQFNAYGFNYELMKDGRFIWIVVHLPFGTQLVTSRNHLLEKGMFLNFQKNKLERQIFLPVTGFDVEKARQSEKHLTVERSRQMQCNLFGEVAQ